MIIDEKAKKNIQELKEYYDNLLERLEDDANISERAYGGYVRSFKGKLVEYMASKLVKIAWEDVLKQNPNRLKITRKKMPIVLTNKYGFLDRVENEEVKKYLTEHQKEQIYKFGTDVQVYIDEKLVMPIECKSFTENAMIKRILFDADLMKKITGCKTYYLLQLESQLGGDYSELKEVTFGSPATNALMSLVDVDLKIITLLKGERKVNEPIHKQKYFKELRIEQLEKVVTTFVNALILYVR